MYRGSVGQPHLTGAAFAITKAAWLLMNQQRREINKAKQGAPSGLDLASAAAAVVRRSNRRLWK